MKFEGLFETPIVSNHSLLLRANLKSIFLISILDKHATANGIGRKDDEEGNLHLRRRSLSGHGLSAVSSSV